MIHRFSARLDGSNWLPDNLNRGKLEYLYWIVTLLQFLNLLYYGVCVRFYTFKPLQLKVAVNEEDVGDVGKSGKEGGA